PKAAFFVPLEFGARPFDRTPETRSLLDLGFLELDVLLDDGVVFAERQLVGLRAAVLARHVEIAGIGGRQKLDLEFCSLGHFSSVQIVWSSCRRNAGLARTRKTCRDT